MIGRIHWASATLPFVWRREWPWLCLLALLAGSVRFISGSHAELYLDVDSYVVGLMARDIAAGERFPLYFYGNNYQTAFTAYVGAPFIAWLGADPRAIAWGQALAFAAIVVPLSYRLWFICGGRFGAVAATLALAIGTRAQRELTAGLTMGYIDLLGVAAALLILALPLFTNTAAPSRRRLLAIGSVAGLGYYCNPQILAFYAVLALAWYARSQTATLIAGERSGPRRLVVVLAWVALAALVFSLAVAIWPLKLALGSVTLSFERGVQYAGRILVGCGLALVVLEGWLAPARWQWFGKGCVLALGLMLGLLPRFAFELSGTSYGMRPMFQLQPTRLVGNLPALIDGCRAVLVGEGALQQPLCWIGSIMAVVGGWRARSTIARLATLRATALHPVLLTLLHVPILLALVSAYPESVERRYLLALWLAWGALLAWGCSWVARAAPRLGLLLVACIALLYSTELIHSLARRAEEPVGERRQVIAQLEELGLRYGYAEYYKCYDLVFLSEGRLTIHVFPHNRPAGDRLPWLGQRLLADRPETVFVLYRREANAWRERDPAGSEAPMIRRYGGSLPQAGGVIDGRWEIGPYEIFRVRRDAAARTRHLSW